MPNNLRPIIPQMFIGAMGQRMTPEQIRNRNKIAQNLMSVASNMAPDAGGWYSVAGKALAGISSGLNESAANRAIEENAARENQNVANALGMLGMDGVSNPTQTDEGLMLASQSAPNLPSSPTADQIKVGLLSRGLPEHVADAFLMNFQDESNLNPAAQEINPQVQGSRGGFGLYQLTGPRRKAYEEFVAARGVDPSDVNSQLDFLVSELQGPEARAGKKILNAPDTNTAAQAILKDFLRPSKKNQSRRAATYQQMSMGPSSSTIAELLGPYSSEGSQRIGSALLNQNLAQQQAAQQQQMAMEQQDQQADARYQVALENGLSPQQAQAVAMSPEAYNQFLKTAYNPSSTPSTVREYEYAQSQLPPEQRTPFNEWDAARRQAGATTVNVGGEGQRIGSIPAGYAVVQDVNNPSGFRFEQIPGSPAEIEAQSAGQKAYDRSVARENQFGLTMNELGRAKSVIQQNPSVSGFLGSQFSKVPGTAAYDVSNLVDSLKSRVTLDTLQKMREQSPTGGALGNVSDADLRILSNSIASLDQGQSQKQLLTNIDLVEKYFNDIINGTKEEQQRLIREGKVTPAQTTYFGGETAQTRDVNTPPEGVDPEVWQFMTPEERALWQ